VAYSGKFNPTNPAKYKGDLGTIVWRSLLELRFMKYLDGHPSVLAWQSEETVIPYISPIDNRAHRYFVDFCATLKTKTGEKTCLIEIKPAKQCEPPTKPKRKTVKATNRYIREAATYVVNQAKWNQAKRVCAVQGWEFVVITDKQLRF